VSGGGVALKGGGEVTFEEHEVTSGVGRGGGGTTAAARAGEVSKFLIGERDVRY
jgi:hypothetical protein